MVSSELDGVAQLSGHGSFNRLPLLCPPQLDVAGLTCRCPARPGDSLRDRHRAISLDSVHCVHFGGRAFTDQFDPSAQNVALCTPCRGRADRNSTSRTCYCQSWHVAPSGVLAWLAGVGFGVWGGNRPTSRRPRPGAFERLSLLFHGAFGISLLRRKRPCEMAAEPPFSRERDAGHDCPLWTRDVDDFRRSLVPL